MYEIRGQKSLDYVHRGSDLFLEGETNEDKFIYVSLLFLNGVLNGDLMQH